MHPKSEMMCGLMVNLRCPLKTHMFGAQLVVLLWGDCSTFETSLSYRSGSGQAGNADLGSSPRSLPLSLLLPGIVLHPSAFPSISLPRLIALCHSDEKVAKRNGVRKH